MQPKQALKSPPSGRPGARQQRGGRGGHAGAEAVASARLGADRDGLSGCQRAAERVSEPSATRAATEPRQAPSATCSQAEDFQNCARCSCRKRCCIEQGSWVLAI